MRCAGQWPFVSRIKTANAVSNDEMSHLCRLKADSAGATVIWQTVTSEQALQRQPRALVPLLLSLDRIDHQLTGYPRNGRTQRLPSFCRTPPGADLHSDS